MNDEIIAVFQSAASNVFRTMLGQQVTVGQVVDPVQRLATHDISGIIGWSGDVSGDVIVSFDQKVARLATAALLGSEPSDVEADVVDAVGELTNMIAGSAKGMLEPYHLSLALPTVILGSGHRIAFKTGVHPVSIPFESDWGAFAVDLGLKMDAPITAV